MASITKHHPHPVSLYCGSVMNNMAGVLVEKPAFIMTKSTGSISRWGEYEKVSAHFDNMARRCAAGGMSDLMNDFVLVAMDEAMISREEQCYILKRLLEYTATSFGKDLLARLESEDLKTWLAGEMARLPLNLEEV